MKERTTLKDIVPSTLRNQNAQRGGIVASLGMSALKSEGPGSESYFHHMLSV